MPATQIKTLETLDLELTKADIYYFGATAYTGSLRFHFRLFDPLLAIEEVSRLRIITRERISGLPSASAALMRITNAVADVPPRLRQLEHRFEVALDRMVELRRHPDVQIDSVERDLTRSK